MAAVNEAIAREYFEGLGYLVTQPVKHAAPGRSRQPAAPIALLISQAGIRPHRLPGHTLWRSADLATVAHAVVSVCGWHTDRFYMSTFEQAPDLFRFVQPASLRYAAQRLGADSFARILCLPRLPAGKATRQKSLDFARQQGVDGIIGFDTMLGELIHRVDTRRNYEKSDLLQIVRLLKLYGLIASDQLELFTGKPAAQRRKKA